MNYLTSCADSEIFAEREDDDKLGEIERHQGAAEINAPRVARPYEE